MTNFDEYLEEQLAGEPEVAREYNRLEAERAAIAAIALAREERGMTLEQLGEATGMRPQSISRIENGRSVPTLRTLSRLAAGMGKKLEVRFV